MNTKLTSGLFGFAALQMASQVNAATVQLSSSVEAIGVSSPFSVIIQAVDFAPTNSGGFSLTWDPTALTLWSGEIEIQNTMFNNGLGFYSVSITQDRLDVIRLASPAVSLSGNFDLINLDFVANPPPVGVTDISFIANQPAWVDENNVDLAPALQPNHVGVSIRHTAVSFVPVPAAVWLFGSGLIGLIGVARRKKA